MKPIAPRPTPSLRYRSVVRRTGLNSGSGILSAFRSAACEAAERCYQPQNVITEQPPCPQWHPAHGDRNGTAISVRNRSSELHIPGCNPLSRLLFVQASQRPGISATLGSKAERLQKDVVFAAGPFGSENVVAELSRVRDDTRSREASLRCSASSNERLRLLEAVAQDVHVLQGQPGADRHTGERVVGDVAGHAGNFH